MEIKKGGGTSKYGYGVQINLTGEELVKGLNKPSRKLYKAVNK